MPRAQEIMTVIAPEHAGEGPVIASVSAYVFKDGYAPENLTVELPVSEIESTPLVAGVKVRALCRIFIKDMADLAPQVIKIERGSDSSAAPNNQGGTEWA